MGEKPASSSGAEIIVVNAGDAALPTRSRNGEAETVDERLLRTIGEIVPADLPPISKLGLETTLAANAEATKSAIASDLDCWRDWCRDDGCRPLPAGVEDLVRYVNALDARGKKPATLARRIASIASVHRMLGLIEGDVAPTDAPMVRAALKAVRRRRGASQRQALHLSAATAQ